VRAKREGGERERKRESEWAKDDSSIKTRILFNANFVLFERTDAF